MPTYSISTPDLPSPFCAIRPLIRVLYAKRTMQLGVYYIFRLRLRSHFRYYLIPPQSTRPIPSCPTAALNSHTAASDATALVDSQSRPHTAASHHHLTKIFAASTPYGTGAARRPAVYVA